MSIQVITKSQTTRKSIEVVKDKNGNLGIKSFEVVGKCRTEMYKLSFIFTTTSFSDKATKHRELMEYLCWENSPIKKQAEDIGWTSDEKKLPKFSNEQLYLPHNIYYACDTEFLRDYCPHIQALAPENAIGGSYGKSGRNEL